MIIWKPQIWFILCHCRETLRGYAPKKFVLKKSWVCGPPFPPWLRIWSCRLFRCRAGSDIVQVVLISPGCSDVVQVSLVSCRSFRCCAGQSDVVQVVLMSCRPVWCRAGRSDVVQVSLVLCRLFWCRAGCLDVVQMLCRSVGLLCSLLWCCGSCSDVIQVSLMWFVRGTYAWGYM
jgi:hypothetical protein